MSQAEPYVGLICLPRLSDKTKRVQVSALGRKIITLARAVRVNSLRTAPTCGANMSVIRFANRGPEHNARATQARVWKSTVTVQWWCSGRTMTVEKSTVAVQSIWVRKGSRAALCSVIKKYGRCGLC